MLFTFTIFCENSSNLFNLQVCQYILDDAIRHQKGAYCNVVVTQPRRISAISVSERVAQERCEILGESVGYSVRFESVLPRPYGAIWFCTVGMFCIMHSLPYLIYVTINTGSTKRFCGMIFESLSIIWEAFPLVQTFLLTLHKK